MKNIFSGLKVLDCTRVFSWPYATRFFADYWAEVIKIEKLDNFDEARTFNPIVNWDSWYFEILNRNKKSISLNLKEKKDLAIFYNLIKEVDIFVENFSPDVKYKLKIDYETLKNINSKIIYWSINWYWENLDKKAYDVIIQAESWFSSLTWVDSPMKNATSVMDTFSGLSLALWITSLLYNREKTGVWGFVNIPMVSVWIQLLEQNLTETSITWKNPDFVWNLDNAIFPFWFFEAGDWYISIAIWNNKLWKLFTDNLIVELKDKFLLNSERIANKEYLKSIIEATFKKYKTKDLVKILDK